MPSWHAELCTLYAYYLYTVFVSMTPYSLYCRKRRNPWYTKSPLFYSQLVTRKCRSKLARIKELNTQLSLFYNICESCKIMIVGRKAARYEKLSNVTLLGRFLVLWLWFINSYKLSAPVNDTRCSLLPGLVLFQSLYGFDSALGSSTYMYP